MASPSDGIDQARTALVAAGIVEEDAALDAEVLARHVLGWDRGRLLAHGRDPAPPGFHAAFQSLIARRIQREPVAQIVGHREFWGLEFEVTSDVLIPRPETELIVEEAVAFGRERPCNTAIDVGTGSGCIAVSVAAEMPQLRVIAADTSARALDVARRNALRHKVADRITFRSSDLLRGIAGPADLILSNPPYVPDGEAAALQPEVARFEPTAALFGGPDGLAVIRQLLHDAPPVLAGNGRLIIEFGFGQEPTVTEIAGEAGWTVVRIRKDLQGIPRTAVLSRSPQS